MSGGRRPAPVALLASGPTRVMGILNLTEDSFSDGGTHLAPETALRHARRMVAEGASIVDVGAESTRPGAQRVPADVERARVVPIVAALAAEGVAVSVDTMRAEVAHASAEAGAAFINDVSGGLADPEMLPVVAASGIGYITMHWRGHSERMQEQAVYADVVAEVCQELEARVEAALAAGIRPDLLAVDPGLGFSKTTEHNWTLLAALDRLSQLAGRRWPLLVGASRKGFLGTLLASDGQPRPPLERDVATAAITALVAQHRVWAVRTHEVVGQCDAVRVAEALRDRQRPLASVGYGAGPTRSGPSERGEGRD